MKSNIVLLFLFSNLTAVIASFLTQILVQKYDVFQVIFLNATIFLLFSIPYEKYKDSKKILFIKNELNANIVIGLLFSISLVFWYYGLQYASLVDATILKFLTPLVILLSSFFILGKKINYQNWLIIILGIVGAIIIIYSNNNYFSSFFILSSVIFSSIFHSLSRKYPTNNIIGRSIIIRIISFVFSLIICALNYTNMDIIKNWDILILILMVITSSIYFLLSNKLNTSKDIENLQILNSSRIIFAIMIQLIFLRDFIDIYTIFGIIIIVFNVLMISVFKNYEKQSMDTNNQLKYLNAEKNNMFIQIVHDLKTPISVIQMSNDILSKENEKYHDMNLSKFAKYIDTNIFRLYNSVNNILKLEKVNNMKDIKVTLQNVNLKDLIKKSVEEIRPIILIKNINLKLNLDDISINTDDEKLKIVVDNILSNAIKFSKSSIEIDLFETNKVVNITFKNDGENIDKEEIDNINKKITTKTGTGYGLNIVTKLLEVIGGKMIIKNVSEENAYNIEFIIEFKKK